MDIAIQEFGSVVLSIKNTYGVNSAPPLRISQDAGSTMLINDGFHTTQGSNHIYSLL